MLLMVTFMVFFNPRITKASLSDGKAETVIEDYDLCMRYSMAGKLIGTKTYSVTTNMASTENLRIFYSLACQRC